jgi:hypothetical protein
MTTLASVYRGDTFIKSFTLGNSWTGAMFTGGVKFTMRRRPASEAVTSDTDALVTVSTTGGEIEFDVGDDALGTITIPASTTNSWPVGSYYWDLQGVVTGSPNRVYTVDAGEIRVLSDVTRAAS